MVNRQGELFSTLALKLVFENPEEARLLPGRSLHGYFFRLLSAASKEIADEVHKAEVKPIALSLLHRDKRDEKLLVFRISLVGLKLYEEFSRFVYKETMSERVRSLDSMPVRIVDVIADGARPYSQLIWASELTEEPFRPKGYSFQFRTPTAFKSGGNRMNLLPEPRLLFTNLIRRWNALSGFSIDEKKTLAAAEELLLSEYLLRTMQLPGHVPTKCYVLKGMTGYINFAIPRGMSSDDRRALTTLVRVAPFLGIGTHTSQGMGQVQTRLLEE